MHAVPVVLSALRWDPQIRGALIVITALAILPGSVYLVLSTDLGAKVGAVVALAGLTGWLTVLSGTWMVFGIGWRGADPTWRAKEIITGPLDVATTPAMRGFPHGWAKFKKGDSKAADAQAAADRVLSSSAASQPAKPGEVAKPDPILKQFPSPFRTTSDYVPLDGYTRGGDNQLFTVRRHKFYLLHSPHYTVVQVQPAVVRNAETGAKPEPDFTKPTVTVVQLRDLGNVRVPPFLVMMSSGIIFGICCSSLHRRDKAIMGLRAAAAT